MGKFIAVYSFWLVQIVWLTGLIRVCSGLSGLRRVRQLNTVLRN